jgi:hypothetical protein
MNHAGQTLRVQETMATPATETPAIQTAQAKACGYNKRRGKPPCQTFQNRKEPVMNEIDGTPKDTSLRQVEANRSNCRRSTGPKTAGGKAQSRMNAVKHGLRSSLVVVRGLQVRERMKDFKDLREQLYRELAPVGTVEEILVDRIVTAQWRIRRALVAEAGEIELSVDGGHWKRKKRGPEAFQAFFEGFHDPVKEMQQSARGLRYLIHALEELREEVTRERELTEAALGRFRKRFGEGENSLARELAGVRDRLAANPGGLSAEALKEKQRGSVLGRIEGRLNLYRMLIDECEEREEKEEAARQAAEVLPSPAVLEKILRYESVVERQLYRAMNQLERMQRRRNGEEVSPPITMDVSGRL